MKKQAQAPYGGHKKNTMSKVGQDTNEENSKNYQSNLSKEFKIQRMKNMMRSPSKETPLLRSPQQKKILMDAAREKMADDTEGNDVSVRISNIDMSYKQSGVE